MKKVMFSLIACLSLCAYTANSQPPIASGKTEKIVIDTSGGQKKDTVFVPIYLIDVSDTIPATITYEKKKGSGRVFITQGFVIVRGFKVFDKEPKWIKKPDVIGVIDKKKNPINNIVQIL
jgi:hypothetical protein